MTRKYCSVAESMAVLKYGRKFKGATHLPDAPLEPETHEEADEVYCITPAGRRALAARTGGGK